MRRFQAIPCLHDLDVPGPGNWYAERKSRTSALMRLDLACATADDECRISEMRVTDAPRALKAVEQHDPSPAGSVIALAGAALAVAACSLPLWDPDSLRDAYPLGFLESNPIDNRLLIRGGWLFIGVALACAVSIAIAYLWRTSTLGPIVAGIVAISLAILAALTAPALLPQTFAFSAGSAAVGIGVHAEMVAGLLMLIGGLRIRRSAPVRALAALGAVGVVLVACAWWYGPQESAPYQPIQVVEAPGG
jgi:hypothetical protein